MNAEKAARLSAELQSVADHDNEEAALRIALELVAGAAVNLARIADALDKTD